VQMSKGCLGDDWAGHRGALFCVISPRRIGGVGLVEMSRLADWGFRYECAIAVEENVAGACEILGFDPIYVANEGRFVAFVPLRM